MSNKRGLVEFIMGSAMRYRENLINSKIPIFLRAKINKFFLKQQHKYVHGVKRLEGNTQKYK